MRQAGGGLGDIFGVLTRQILPSLARAAVPIAKSQAKKLAPKILSSGVGLMSDLANKRNLKQALKSRGKRLVSDVINQATANKRHKPSGRRTSKSHKKRARKPKKKKNTRRGKRRDIFV